MCVSKLKVWPLAALGQSPKIPASEIRATQNSPSCGLTEFGADHIWGQNLGPLKGISQKSKMALFGHVLP